MSVGDFFPRGVFCLTRACGCGHSLADARERTWIFPLAAYRMCANTLAMARTACRGAPPLMRNMGGGGDRLSRLHSTTARRDEAWPLLPGTAAAPSPTKRDGVRAPRPCRLLGCAAMRKRAVTYTRRHRHHAGQQHNTPAPGWREPPRGADGPQPGAAWTRQRQALLGWAGANTTDSAARA